MALNESNHRLFIACRGSHVVVLDNKTGKGVTAFPITKGVDDITYDPQSKRLHFAADGTVDVFEQ